MAFEKFGIKEVADVRFYEVGDVEVGENGAVNPKSGKEEILSFDTLKVSTIEFTAEQAEARGGKGNAPLIIWDYGREINVTLEDALLSMKALNIMFGDKSSDNRIEINADRFPGVYTVVGKTFARDQLSGKDHLFTFYIPRAKVQSENTLTMEADGDPTVLNLSLRVLRGEGGKMMELIADESPYTGTDLWGAGDPATYTIQFVDKDNKVHTYKYSYGTTIVAPVEAGEGYTWPKFDTVNGDATYYAVSSASGT